MHLERRFGLLSSCGIHSFRGDKKRVQMHPLNYYVNSPYNQVDSTCTKLSKNVGECPMSPNSAELVMLTVPLLSCRQ